MKNLGSIRERFLKDPLPVRLGGLAADLRRISSSSRRSGGAEHVAAMLEESQYFIEWVAAELEPDDAAELVEIQIMLALWKRSWFEAQRQPAQRSLLTIQAKRWSDRVLQMSGLIP